MSGELLLLNSEKKPYKEYLKICFDVQLFGLLFLGCFLHIKSSLLDNNVLLPFSLSLLPI